MMNTWIFRLLAVLLCCGTVSAEVFRTTLGKLEFDEDQPGLTEVLDGAAGWRWAERLAIRFPGEAYVGGAGSGIKRADWPVVLRVEDGGKLRGWVDVFGRNGSAGRSFGFVFDAGTAQPCSGDEFAEVKKQSDGTLAGLEIPGRSWFRHQAGVGEVNERPGFRRTEDLEDTFAVFSGARAVAENLALDRDLWLAGGKDGERVMTADIKGVTVKEIDWSGRLTEGDAVAVDALSLAVPRDQHAVFFPSVAELLQAGEFLDERLDASGAALGMDALAGVVARYRKQLGLDFPDVAARLLPVESVVLTGGDPFFPLGTDVALVFESKRPGFLYQSLSKSVGVKAEKSGATALEWDGGGDGGGVSYAGWQTVDRRFSGHVLRKGDLVMVSNSQAQLRKLVMVGAGVPALGDTDEYRFFRHRYPLGAGESAFVFVSDAALRRWCGPEVRIGASRRTRALAAMSVLACRMVAGDPPGDVYQEFLGPVSDDGGSPVSAVFGAGAFLTPVAELDLDSVTKTEADAYERWRTGYERGWARVFDPIALRVELADVGGGLDLTVLPLTVGSDYQRIMELVGRVTLEERARMVPEGSAMHLAMALDTGSPLFRELNENMMPEILPGLRAKPLGWVGESVSLTIEDGCYWKLLPDFPNHDMAVLESLPVVLRVASTSRLKLAAFLTGVRAAVEKSAPDMLEWTVHEAAGASYVEVSAEGETISVYYAGTPDALLISLDAEVMKRAIERELGEVDAERVVATDEAGQLMVEVAPGVMDTLATIVSSQTWDQRRRWASWSALPVLNEWKRRFPDQDPVAVHARLFGEHIMCPGGGSYVWDRDALTMVSSVYGHPGAPKDGPGGGTGGLMRRVGLEFADGGLRAKLVESAPRPGVAADGELPGNGVVLASAGDLVDTTVGTVLSYEGEGPDGREMMVAKLTGAEKHGDGDGDGMRLTTESTYTAGDEEFVSTEVSLLANGLMQVESMDETSRTVYQVPDLELPAILIEGMRVTRPFESLTTFEDKGGDGAEELTDEVTRGFGTIEVVGLETIETPAGTFADCVKVKTLWQSVDGFSFTRQTGVSWYAKGVGIVKWELDSRYGHSTMQLVEIRK